MFQSLHDLALQLLDQLRMQRAGTQQEQPKEADDEARTGDEGQDVGRSEVHWSATPVEVDADTLMESLQHEIEIGEAEQQMAGVARRTGYAVGVDFKVRVCAPLLVRRMSSPLLFWVCRRQLGVAVHVIEGDRATSACREGDQSLRARWRDGLPFFVGRDVALRAPDACSQFSLGDAEPHANCFDGIHEARVSAPLIHLSISGADFRVTASLILRA